MSYGSGFLKAAIGATKRLAQEILEKGTVAAMKEGMQTPEINILVAKKNQAKAMSAASIVVSIHIAPTGAAPMKSLMTVKAVAGQGLEGDGYALVG